MNPRSRKTALYAIGAIAIAASVNALAHSYAGLYEWALHHRLTGWQAMSWPAEIDVFLAVGELALYVANVDGWPARQRVWPWATALTGLAVSVAGNVGHIVAEPGQPVVLADRLTAAASPLAAFAGLSVGLLVLKMSRQQATRPQHAHTPAALVLAPPPGPPVLRIQPQDVAEHADPGPGQRLLHDAQIIYQNAAARGQHLSQRTLARELRDHGHQYPNGHLRLIAQTIGQAHRRAA